MEPHIKLIRAIGSEFARRKLAAITVITLIISVGVTIGAFLLLFVSVWWAILLAVVFIIEIIVFGFLILTTVVLRTIKPQLTPQQTTAVRDFVDKLERVADHIGTPKIIILFRVVRDIIRPHGTTFIQSVASDSTTLHSDYIDLQKRFR